MSQLRKGNGAKKTFHADATRWGRRFVCASPRVGHHERCGAARSTRTDVTSCDLHEVSLGRMAVRTVLLALLVSQTAALLLSPPTTGLLPSCTCGADRFAAAARTPHAVMMGKKTSWSIGNARKKKKKAKVSKPTAASQRGESGAKGFQITKEKCGAGLFTFLTTHALHSLTLRWPTRFLTQACQSARRDDGGGGD